MSKYKTNENIHVKNTETDKEVQRKNIVVRKKADGSLSEIGEGY